MYVGGASVCFLPMRQGPGSGPITNKRTTLERAKSSFLLNRHYAVVWRWVKIIEFTPAKPNPSCVPLHKGMCAGGGGVYRLGDFCHHDDH